jgi:hypothetical protein
VDATTSQIRLRCTVAEFQALHPNASGFRTERLSAGSVSGCAV